ncbi:hypothetical protein D3C77_354680 [compost metagenome]
MNPIGSPHIGALIFLARCVKSEMFTIGPAQLDTSALTQAMNTSGLAIGVAGVYAMIGPMPPAMLMAQIAAPIMNT